MAHEIIRQIRDIADKIEESKLIDVLKSATKIYQICEKWLEENEFIDKSRLSQDTITTQSLTLKPESSSNEIVLETFNGILDRIDGDTAHVTLYSTTNTDVLYAEYLTSVFSEKGIKEEDLFILKTIEKDGVVRIEIEALPDTKTDNKINMLERLKSCAKDPDWLLENADLIEDIMNEIQTIQKRKKCENLPWQPGPAQGGRLPPDETKEIVLDYGDRREFITKTGHELRCHILIHVPLRWLIIK
jgi:hypothetical protein